MKNLLELTLLLLEKNLFVLAVGTKVALEDFTHYVGTGNCDGWGFVRTHADPFLNHLLLLAHVNGLAFSHCELET